MRNTGMLLMLFCGLPQACCCALHHIRQTWSMLRRVWAHACLRAGQCNGQLHTCSAYGITLYTYM